MNMKLKKILDEIQRTEGKIAEWQTHLQELNIRKKQLEDAEIIKSIRSMKLESRELLGILDSIQKGTAVFLEDDTASVDDDVPEAHEDSIRTEGKREMSVEGTETEE